MATYIVLAHFSDQGIRGVKDSPKRADAFKALAKKAGANVKELYWTLGSYDIVAIVEAPDIRTHYGDRPEHRQTGQRTHRNATRVQQGGDGRDTE